MVALRLGKGPCHQPDAHCQLQQGHCPLPAVAAAVWRAWLSVTTASQETQSRLHPRWARGRSLVTVTWSWTRKSLSWTERGKGLLEERWLPTVQSASRTHCDTGPCHRGAPQWLSSRGART
jgi:hypothetical protein